MRTNHNPNLDLPTDSVPPAFAARLTAHRSLSPRGFRILMGLLCLLCLGAGMGFWLVGAWPVFGFLGLDLLAIWLAFRLNYRAAGGFEEIAVWRDNLLVRKVSPAGKVEEFSFNPLWTRFVVNRHEEAGITAMALTAPGRNLPIGACLNPPDRESFALAFSRALATCK